MNQIISDRSMFEQLRGLVEPCVVVDPAGHKLGLFCPDIDRSYYDSIEPSVSNEELERRERRVGTKLPGNRCRPRAEEMNEVDGRVAA